MAAVILVLSLIAVPVAALAETIRLRAGEHQGFSRIALDLAAPADWHIGRTRSGYELRLSRADISYDVARVFRAIPRSRIADIADGTRPGTLALTLGCDCHALAFQTGSGTIVVDVHDGPAPEGSPFEAVFNEPDIPGLVPILPLFEAGEEGDVALVRRPTAEPDPRLALSQAGLAAGRSVAVPQPPPPAHGADSQAPANPVAALPLPLVPPADVADRALNLSVLAIPDPRVAEIEADLLEQLGRAAAQGLIDTDVRGRRDKAGTTPAPNHAQPTVVDPPLPASPPGDPFVHIETGIDRDVIRRPERVPVTADGMTCLADADVAIQDWGDDRPASRQIAELRTGLVGEFDRPSHHAVVALARLYLYLGFGAEARAVVAAFPPAGSEGQLILDMGAILDGEASQAPSRLSGMTDCDTAVALWGVLARSEPDSGVTVNTGAVVRAFSALPLHLRMALGVPLSDRLIRVGAIDAARAIRDAINRATATGGEAVGMMDARIKLARGEAHEAEALFDRIAMSNDPDAAEALILTIRSRLDRGEAVPVKLADTAAALAFEMQAEASGGRLEQAHLLARASTGDIDEAFAAYDRWMDLGMPDPLQAETLRMLWSRVVKVTDDQTFLTAIFSDRHSPEQAEPDPELRLAIAERLLGLGFNDEVRSILHGDVGETGAGRRLRAEAAIGSFDARTALAEIEGLDDEGSQLIRARALAMLGDHSAAASVYAAAERPADAGIEAWRAGDLVRAAEIGPDPLRAALAEIRPVPGDRQSATPDSFGPMAEAQKLVEDSKAARDALAVLLATTGEPANPN
ncbi:MAG: hypothetical protein KDE08_06850 [Rhodobacteraceae bacterium]|nr:hypothetical protein [Paracoccaceae bacterium]